MVFYIKLLWTTVLKIRNNAISNYIFNKKEELSAAVNVWITNVSEEQMSEYLTANGDESFICEII